MARQDMGEVTYLQDPPADTPRSLAQRLAGECKRASDALARAAELALSLEGRPEQAEASRCFHGLLVGLADHAQSLEQQLRRFVETAHRHDAGL